MIYPMRIFRIAVLLCTALSSSILSAATVEVGSGSSIILGLVTDFSTVYNYDVRGAGTFTVTPPGDAAGVFDIVGGSDPNYGGSLPFGNNTLYLQAGADFASLVLSFSSVSFNGSDASVVGTVSALSPNPSSAALLSLIANSPLTLNFTYLSLSAIADTNLSLVQWQLSSVVDSEVPEPASLGMMSAGIALFAVIAKRRTGR